MSAQPTLWGALEERDKALAAVEDHADVEWLGEALTALYRTAERLPDLISDDVWASGLDSTHEDRALGPVFRKAAKLGWITRDPEGRTRPSRRSHGSGKTIWLSHLYFGPRP